MHYNVTHAANQSCFASTLVIERQSEFEGEVFASPEEKIADAMDVDPDVLLFTQDSIACRFRPPYQNQRIDDTVDSIVRGKKQASEFPSLEVVLHEGRLWSLDNRRLWVFKKARVPRVKVNLVNYNYHSRFTDLMDNKPELKSRILEEGYWPAVRGICRTEFVQPDWKSARLRPSRPIHFGEEIDANTGPRIRPITIPEWQVPRSWSTKQVNIEPDEDVEEPAVNDFESRDQTKVLVGLTLIIAVLLGCAQFRRNGDSKLLMVVKGYGMSGRTVPEPTTNSLASDFSRGIVSVFLRVLSEIFGKLILDVIPYVFRVVWGLMWRLVWRICSFLFSRKGLSF